MPACLPCKARPAIKLDNTTYTSVHTALMRKTGSSCANLRFDIMSPQLSMTPHRDVSFLSSSAWIFVGVSHPPESFHGHMSLVAGAPVFSLCSVQMSSHTWEILEKKKRGEKKRENEKKRTGSSRRSKEEKKVAIRPLVMTPKDLAIKQTLIPSHRHERHSWG